MLGAMDSACGMATGTYLPPDITAIGSPFLTIPLIDRKSVSGASKALKGPSLTPFDSETWNIAEWTKG